MTLDYHSFFNKLQPFEMACADDLFLSHKKSDIISQIYKHSLTDYCKPYSSIDLKTLQQVTSLPREVFHQHLKTVILSGEVLMTIDQRSNALVDASLDRTGVLDSELDKLEAAVSEVVQLKSLEMRLLGAKNSFFPV